MSEITENAVVVLDQIVERLSAVHATFVHIALIRRVKRLVIFPRFSELFPQLSGLLLGDLLHLVTIKLLLLEVAEQLRVVVIAFEAASLRAFRRRE